MKYEFKQQEIERVWNEYIYFDIETVRDMHELREIKATKDIAKQLQTLDVRNATYVVFAIHEKYPRFSRTEFRQRKIENFTYYYNIKPLSYEKIAQILVDIATRYNMRGFIAHNGKRFDFLIFKHAGYTIQTVKTSTFLHANSKRFRLVDTTDISKTFSAYSLEDTATKLSLNEKKAIESDDIVEYTMQDVRLLTKIVERYNELEFSETTTRTARRALFDYMAKHGIESIKSEAPAWLDYAGGRAEPFFHYLDHGYSYDANSLYPSSLSHFLYGLNCVEIRDYDAILKTKAYIDAQLRKLPSIIEPMKAKEAFENVFRGYHFVLLVRLIKLRDDLDEATRKIVRFYFPFSHIEPNITSRDARVYSLKNTKAYQVSGYELYFLQYFEYDIISACYYEASENFFAPLIRDLYEQRKLLKATNNDREKTAKLLMNSSYGVFGLRNTNKRTKRKYFAYNSIPLYAILTTSHARFFMLNMIHYIASRGHIVVYTDTDSLFTTCPPDEFPREYLNGNMLGFKHEKSFRNLFVLNPKTYIYTDTATNNVCITAKGTGRTFHLKTITQTLKKDTPHILDRYAIKLSAIPVKIPATANYVSVYNYERKQYFTAYRDIIMKARTIYPDAIDELLLQDDDIASMIYDDTENDE